SGPLDVSALDRTTGNAAAHSHRQAATVQATARGPARRPLIGQGMDARDKPGMTTLRDLHVFEVARLVVDADFGRRDPARELARLHLRLHQALDKIAVGV